VIPRDAQRNNRARQSTGTTRRSRSRIGARSPFGSDVPFEGRWRIRGAGSYSAMATWRTRSSARAAPAKRSVPVH